MNLRSLGLVSPFFILLFAGPAASQPPPSFPQEPVLQLEAGGPNAAVTGLVFAPDGKSLYAAGFDKMVRAWAIGKDGTFTLSNTYRVPIGPGADGALNALALSPDGRWLAVAGHGVMREAAGFRQVGILEPRIGRPSKEMLEDQGTIYLFDTTNKKVIRALRKHRGPVLSLAFADPQPGKPLLLVSVGREPEGDKDVGVLRLWDADAGKPLARSQNWADPRDSRPGLAVWHTGKGAQELGVALACNDQPLRVWDVANNRLRVYAKKGGWNDTLTYLPGKNLLLTGFFEEPGAKLQRWRVVGTTLEEDGAAPLLDNDGAPRALALIPGPGNDRVVTVAYYRDKSKDPNKQYRLLVSGPADGPNFGTVATKRDLWRGAWQPALAVSPKGNLLALGSHDIRIFDLAGRPAAPKEVLTLRSEGMRIHRARFARSDGEALLISAGDNIPRLFRFDVKARRLLSGLKVKAVEPPDLGDWSVKPAAPQKDLPPAFEVSQVGGKTTQIRLDKDQKATAVAILPPSAPLNQPLLAVGVVEGGATSISLYDVKSGQQVRRFTGHLGPVHSLAFDAKGRLLISAAEDRTVCVWGLTDLGKTLGKHGKIRGLAFEPGKGGLVVARVEEKALSPANRASVKAKGLARGDEILTVTIGKKARKFDTPHDFYETLWQLPPWTTEEKKTRPTVISLEVRGKGAVALTLDQGIDDHKPLFSLFLPDGGAGTWVAWSPSGPYDTSDRARGESSVGWHRNPGKVGEPVEFSTADKYRKEYRREGILRHLIAKVNLGAAIDAWKAEPVPRPGLGLWIDELDPLNPRRDDKGRLVLQGTAFTVKAEVMADPGKVKQVRWQFDDQKPRSFDAEESETRWSATLAKLLSQPGMRGPHELNLLVTTVDGVEHREPMQIRYLPFSPAVRFDPAWLAKLPKDRTVKAADLDVKGIVTPGDNGPNGPRVKLSLRHNDKMLGELKKEAGKVKLLPGDNVLELVAENEGASPDMPEVDSAQVIVRYVPKKVPPPQITLESVEPEGGGALRLQKGKTTVVHAPLVRIRGRIAAEAPLTEASLNSTALTGFKAGQKSPFRIDQTFKLKAGKNELAFFARAGVGAGSTVSHKIELTWQPDLPRLDPSEPRSLTRRASDSLDFAVRLRLTELAHPFPYRVFVKVNDEKKLLKATVSPERLLMAEARLVPGRNRLQILVENDYWKRPPEEIFVKHPQPPVIVALAAPAETNKPFVDLTARIKTPAGLPVLGGRLNELELEPTSLVQKKAGSDEWTVLGVPLKEGKNTLELTVRNNDGMSLKGRSVSVLYKKPPKLAEKPRIEMISPRGNSEVTTPKTTVVFRVEVSEPRRPVTVGVRLNGKALSPGDPEEVTGGLVYRLTTPLQMGTNQLQVTAKNEGGPATPVHIVVNYLPPWTVAVRTVRVESRDKPGTFFDLPLKAPLPKGNVLLHGHVEWRNAGDPALKQRVWLRVWVNDFEQFFAELEPAKGKRRAFKAGLRLNRSENRVQLQLSATDLKTSPDSSMDLVLRCARPESDQRLHLVIVGPGQRDQEALRERVLKAFLAEKIPGRKEYRTPAFREVRVHTKAMASDINPDQLKGYLMYLERFLRKTPGPLNDVVIVFFSGEEKIKGGRHYLLTPASNLPGRFEDASFVFDDIRAALSGFLGAKLLLLDVRRDPGPPLPRADRDDFPHLGVFRYVWLGRKDAPAKARLVSALQDTLAKGALVRDQEQLLQTWAQGFGQQAHFLPLIPSGLQGMQLGKAGRR